MVDVAALKAIFAGYSNILAHIDMLIKEEDWFCLRRLAIMRRDEQNQTVSSAEFLGRAIPLHEMDDFLKYVHKTD